jgi:transaldolase
MTSNQVVDVLGVLNPSVQSNISVFAGRIADTGTDPVRVMQDCLQQMKVMPNSKLIWASPRELLNVFQADAIGCHIITATNDILKKLSLVGYDLDQYSLDTVKMFHDDALSAGYSIEV